jgi:hypothetical protein
VVLEAPAAPPAYIIELLSRLKPEIMVLLRHSRDGWSAEDWQVFFDERAGIAELDGGLTRVEAEALAFACCVAEWLNRNPVRSPPDRCLACGGDHAHERLLPFGIEPTRIAWLHAGCWSHWHTGARLRLSLHWLQWGSSLVRKARVKKGCPRHAIERALRPDLANLEFRACCAGGGRMRHQTAAARKFMHRDKAGTSPGCFGDQPQFR